MSDSDAYSYEYDEDSAGGNEEASFEYTDDETSKQDDAVNIENTYYNAKASRDNGEFTEAIEGLESVVVMEVESIRKGSDDDGENCMWLWRDISAAIWMMSIVFDWAGLTFDFHHRTSWNINWRLTSNYGDCIQL